MATFQVGESKPYMAVNGHRMVAPLYQADRDGAVPFTISAYAYCVATCPACAGGGTLSDYCGEVEDDDGW